jgi:hypothetical protein
LLRNGRHREKAWFRPELIGMLHDFYVFTTCAEPYRISLK